jgi:hypothetical protein
MINLNTSLATATIVPFHFRLLELSATFGFQRKGIGTRHYTTNGDEWTKRKIAIATARMLEIKCIMCD